MNRVFIILMILNSFSSHAEALKPITDIDPMKEELRILLDKSYLNCDSYAALTNDYYEFKAKLKKFVISETTNLKVVPSGGIELEGTIDYAFRLKVNVVTAVELQKIKELNLKLYHDVKEKKSTETSSFEDSTAKKEELIAEGNCIDG